MLTPTYKFLPLFRLAGIRRFHTFATAPETIPPQWNEFNASPLPGRAEAPVTYGATCQMDMPTSASSTSPATKSPTSTTSPPTPAA